MQTMLPKPCPLIAGKCWFIHFLPENPPNIWEPCRRHTAFLLNTIWTARICSSLWEAVLRGIWLAMRQLLICGELILYRFPQPCWHRWTAVSAVRRGWISTGIKIWWGHFTCPGLYISICPFWKPWITGNMPAAWRKS